MSYYTRGTDYLPYLRRPTVDGVGWDLGSPSRPIPYRRPLSTSVRRDGPLLDRDYGSLLDRDYGDFRMCRRMESGNLLYPRPPSPGYTRKHMLELEDELKMHKDELARRERLIGDLKGNGSSLHVPPSCIQTEICGICNHGNEINMSEQEIETLKSKTDNLQQQLKEMEILLQSKDKKIQDLKNANKSIKQKEKNKKKSESGSEDESGSSSSSESDHSGSAPEKESKKPNACTPDMDSQLSELRHECMRLQKENGTSASKIDEFAQQNAQLNQELSVAKSHLEKMEKEQQSNHRHIAEERDAVLGKHKHLESEVSLLQGRLDKSQHELMAARTELEQHMVHCGGLDRERRHQESVARSTETQFASFKETLARILTDSSMSVDPSETRIIQRMEELMAATKEKTLLIQRLERRVDEFSNKLEAEFENPGGIRKHHHVRSEITDLEARLKRAEKELLTRDEARKEVHLDREKFWHYLTRLCVALEMKPVTVNLGLDEAVLTILARVEDIMRRDIDALSKVKTHNAHLQQKLSRMNDQLESKESHLELQRRKIASLEEQLSMRTGIDQERVEFERENEFAKNRKMRKLIEKYRQELKECHAQIRELKSRLLYSNDIETRVGVKDRELLDLENEVDELEHERFWHANKIAGLERGLQSASEHIVEKKEVANNTIHALSIELRTTKEELQEITKRERRLLELRLVVARMLGLDVTTLTVPDYEIISRLEKLILANQANCTTAVALDNAVAGLNENFQIGYHHGNIPNAKNHRRSRSLSPRRRLDKKTY